MPSAGDAARVASAAQSDVGRTRSENQDAFGEFSSASGERLFVVADGMGGHRGGATASRLCVETLGRAFTEGNDPAEERLRRGLELANARIHDAAQRDLELGGMGTTAVALILAPDGTGVVGWVGDSRAYRFRGGALERLSTDHSVVGEMIRAGVITEQEADTHERRNELLRAIGPHEDVEPETRAIEHAPGDRFLLCSDGLWGPVPEPEIAMVLGFEAPERAVRKLIAKANERGGPDNVTAQIASVGNPAAASTAPAPAEARGERTRRAPALPLLAGGAAAAAALLIALAVYGLRQGEQAGEPAPVVAALPLEEEEEETIVELETVEPEAPPAAETKPAEVKKPAAPPREVAAAKPAPAKPPAAKKETPKPEPAKPAPPKPAPAKQEPAKPAPAKQAAAVPTPEPPQATLVAAKAAKPIETTPVPTAPAPVAPEPSAPAPEPVAAAPAPPAPSVPSRVEVEQFLSDWEAAIASKDFALYSRLGLPGSEQAFKTRYVDNRAKVAFSLRDYSQSQPDQLIVRVQMVLETQDATGPRRVDEERRFLVKQTPEGLRYVGLPKN